MSTLCCNYPTEEAWLAPADTAPFAVVETRLPVADLSKPQPRDPSIELRFSDYPDPATLNFPALSLGPRGQSIQFSVSVSLVDKSITLRARDHLIPDTDYFVFLDPAIRSLAGRPLADGEGFAFSFHTGMQLSPPAPPEPTVRLTQLLAKATGGALTGCGRAGCHSTTAVSSPPRGLDLAAAEPVVRESLRRRAGPFRLLLVDPGRPEQSYLLRKLLARRSGEFLQIDGEPMPPLASTDSPLDDGALRSIETWIRQGAQ